MQRLAICLGLIFSCSIAIADGPVLEFANMFGEGGGENPYDIAVDATGSVYAVGFTTGKFNGETNAFVSRFDCFLVKLDKNGTHLWTRIWGSTSDEIAFNVCLGASNDLYVAGVTLGAFDGQTNNSVSTSPFLSKFDINGNREWSRIWGGSANSEAIGVYCFTNTEICVVGNAGLNFDGNTNFSERGFITRFTADGTKLSSTLWGDSSIDAKKFIPDSASNLYVTGHSSAGPGLQSIFLSKISPNGSNIWQMIWGSEGIDWSKDICMGVNGYIYVCGIAAGSIDSQPCPSPPLGFVSQISTNGNREWTKIYPWSSVQGCTPNPSGGVYVVGHTDFNHFDYINPGTSSHYLAWINETGTSQWFRLFGSDMPDGANSVEYYDGSEYVFGSSEGDMLAQSNQGSSDGVITKWSEKDSDRDGIPDVWENTYSMNPFSASDGTNDLDSDGVLNITEYLTGTDPQNSSSKLEMTSLTFSNAQCHFEWSGGVDARQYLKYTTNIMIPIDEWQIIYTNPAPTASSVSFSYIPSSSNSIGYFSLEAGR